jgi:hypothetical protein
VPRRGEVAGLPGLWRVVLGFDDITARNFWVVTQVAGLPGLWRVVLGVGKTSVHYRLSETVLLVKAMGLMTSLPGIFGLLHNDAAYVGRGLMTPPPEVTSLPKMWGILAIQAKNHAFVTNVKTRNPSEELCNTCGSKLVQCQYEPAAPPHYMRKRCLFDK